MKNQNYLMTGLAIVGAISLFILACAAAEESNDSNNNNSTNSVGKYQITSENSLFHVLDTETGIVKTYKFRWISTTNDTFEYVYKTTTVTQ
jgi:hypothetical protein